MHDLPRRQNPAIHLGRGPGVTGTTPPANELPHAVGQLLMRTSVSATSDVAACAARKPMGASPARGRPADAPPSGAQMPWPAQLLDAAQICAYMPSAIVKQLGAMEVYEELDSTSSELQRRGSAAPDLSIVLAQTQLAGRGRRGHTWLSPPGMNLYLSCLKRFNHGFAGQAGLSLAVGVMLMRALAELEITGAGLKWPNDVLARDAENADGKLAGILVELGGDYQGLCTAVIGIGLNVYAPPALRAQAGQPVCDLAALNAGTLPERNCIAASVITALVTGLRQFECEGFAGFSRDYAEHDLLRDQLLRVTGAFATLDGVGDGVDARGALRVCLSDGSVRVFDSANVTVRRQ